MKPLYKVLCLFLSLAIFLGLTACGKDYSSQIIYFELDNKPDTLDAQLASTDQELLLVRNIYEGLLREDIDGKIVNGVCESYQKDGLSYTFKIRKNAAWSTGENLTADDFVFAFRRAVSPETNAPFVKRLFSVANAQKIYKGTAQTEGLGVKALDSKTLKITLEKEDEDFLKTLTTSICMPCNEAFFNKCHGQYGLKSEYIISNGSYSITKWNREDFGIRIYKNSSYKGDFTAKNRAVFLSLEDDATPTERLSENKVDIAFIQNKDIDFFNDDNFTTVSFENICWFLNLGDQYGNDIKNAFSLLVDSSVYQSKLPAGFSAADTVFPKSLGDNTSYSKVGFNKYDPAAALSLFSRAVVKFPDKKFPSTTLTYTENEEIKPVVTAIVGHWQQSLSAFINISSYNINDDLIPQLEKKTLPFSVFYIKATSGYIDEYLEHFGIDYNGQDLSNLQTEILASRNIIPIAFENTNLVYNNCLYDVHTSTLGGYIDFSFIIKKD